MKNELNNLQLHWSTKRKSITWRRNFWTEWKGACHIFRRLTDSQTMSLISATEQPFLKQASKAFFSAFSDSAFFLAFSRFLTIPSPFFLAFCCLRDAPPFGSNLKCYLLFSYCKFSGEYFYYAQRINWPPHWLDKVSSDNISLWPNICGRRCQHKGVSIGKFHLKWKYC